MIRGNISVRQLAEFTCRSGDLYNRRLGRQVSPEEGVEHQQLAQAKRLKEQEAYQREVSLKLSFTCAGQPRELKGRADGLIYQDTYAVIEEFKCTGQLPEQVDPVDRGQALIYAGLLAWENDQVSQFEVNVIYLEVDTQAERVFTEKIDRVTACSTLDFMLLCYCARIERHLLRTKRRRTWAEALNFPMAQFRPAQQALARRVYQALTKGENLLLEAPTGSGKTLGVLFPAVKSLADNTQLFFLTSRNMGAQAAMMAAHQLDHTGKALSVIELTAKEKVCLVDSMPCDPDRCEYARGYFDKVGPAINELLNKGIVHQTDIDATARKFTVCPFELSLDTALWADLIIGDYNYILDPVVRLKRLSGHEELHLLVDEAHQLSPRVRDMLAVTLDRDMIWSAKPSGHAGLDKRINSIDRALLALRRQHGQGEHPIDPPDAITRACTKLLDFVAREDLALDAYPDAAPLYFAATRWVKSQQWLESDELMHSVTAQNKQICVRKVCLDAGRYMQKIFSEHAGVVRFSATVSPLPLYQRLHGDKQDLAERAPSPFTAEQTCVLIVDDIPTYYKQRQQSLARLVALVNDICQLKRGQYLVALPSYEYLRMLCDALEVETLEIATTAEDEGAPCERNHPPLQVLAQQPGQTKSETQALIQSLSESDCGVLCIVMGGVLGESIDFGEASLSGVFLIGLGLPPPNLEREAMQSYFEHSGGAGWGRLAAYTQPALVKNVQAAGRLIRSEDDFGVICLIDPRFTSSDVQRFFPNHWRPKKTCARDAIEHVENFWHHTSGTTK